MASRPYNRTAFFFVAGWRREDVASVVQSPRRVQHVDKVVTKLEEGDLKLRVRVLESEAAFARIEAVQGSLSSAVMATLLLNAGVLMAPGGGGAVRPAAVMASRAMLAMAGFFGLKIPVGYFKVRPNRCVCLLVVLWRRATIYIYESMVCGSK